MVDTQSSLPFYFPSSRFHEPLPKHVDWPLQSSRDSGNGSRAVDLNYTESTAPCGRKQGRRNNIITRSSSRVSLCNLAAHTSAAYTSIALPPVAGIIANATVSSLHADNFKSASLDPDPNMYRSMSSQGLLDPHHHRHFLAGSQAHSRASSRPASPIFQLASSMPSSKDGSVIVPYLQLPSTITTSKGSLAEFAAQITCLFWFETSGTLDRIESLDLSPLMTNGLVSEAYPTTGFMKWVTTILSTTQVTQNVILLALLFIYRLKKQCPNVKGKLGSEYRLLTVALMLGNKFLDDNTYTNKTWAEVSGISVREIHVMEVEFLSHMKYDLYTSKERWDKWHAQLSGFWQYFDQASRSRSDTASTQAEMRRPSLQMPYALPSPPASTNASPPYYPSISPDTISYYNAPFLPVRLAPLAPSPAASVVEYGQSQSVKKRSIDSSVQEPAAKRQSVQGTYSSNTSQVAHRPMPNLIMPNLPMPNLPMPHSNFQQSYNQGRGLVTPHSSGGRDTPPASLPPLNWLAGMPPSGSYQNAQNHLLPAPESHYERQSRIHTPIATPAMYPASSAGNYSSTPSHSIPPSEHSPSHYLTSRSSPYRPVRNISALLVPPPSNSMHQYPSNMQHEQMRWQPLGKNVDERSGRVPYLHRDAWPQTHQLNQWPPS